MNKRVVSIVLIILIFALSLSGCNNSSIPNVLLPSSISSEPTEPQLKQMTVDLDDFYLSSELVVDEFTFFSINARDILTDEPLTAQVTIETNISDKLDISLLDLKASSEYLKSLKFSEEYQNYEIVFTPKATLPLEANLTITVTAEGYQPFVHSVPVTIAESIPYTFINQIPHSNIAEPTFEDNSIAVFSEDYPKFLSITINDGKSLPWLVKGKDSLIRHGDNPITLNVKPHMKLTYMESGVFVPALTDDCVITLSDAHGRYKHLFIRYNDCDGRPKLTPALYAKLLETINNDTVYMYNKSIADMYQYDPIPQESVPCTENEDDLRILSDLAHEITLGRKTPIDKAKAIAKWVATNITYNQEQADYEGPDYETLYKLDPITVYNTRTNVCTGYANLTNELLRLSGIPSRIVAGCADWTADDVVPNHVWNEAYIDYDWMIIDTTWMNGSYIYNPNDLYDYFDVDLESFSKTHLISYYQYGLTLY